LYDAMELELRCLICGRARRPKLRPDAAIRPKMSAFRRNWLVAPAELTADCGG
jgi:hypothetical protein